MTTASSAYLSIAQFAQSCNPFTVATLAVHAIVFAGTIQIGGRFVVKTSGKWGVDVEAE